MTLIWLICYLTSNCPAFWSNPNKHAWIVTLVICILLDIIP